MFLFSIEGLALDESSFPHFPPKKNDKGLKVLAKFPLDQACMEGKDEFSTWILWRVIFCLETQVA